MVPAPGNANTASSRGWSAGTARASFPFRAELDLSEIDSRGRPGQTWTGRGAELSRSTLIFRSKRMCYEGRQVVVAVHLVDDKPVPLYGLVSKSEYEGDGLYRTILALHAIPEMEVIRDWLADIQPRVL